jgi:hypothetical protein
MRTFGTLLGWVAIGSVLLSVFFVAWVFFVAFCVRAAYSWGLLP